MSLRHVVSNVAQLQKRGLVKLESHQVMDWGDEFINDLGGYDDESLSATISTET